MAPKASGSGMPIAISTGDALRSPELQADPAESEKRRMAMITDSASTRSKLTFRLPGNLSSRGPLTKAPSISDVKRSHSSSRNAVSITASAAISSARMRKASAIPITPGTFSVPGRTFRS